MSGRKSLLYYPLALFIAGFSAFFLWKAVAPYKLGIAPDSISYLSVSKHIAAGKGVRVYMANLSKTSDPIAAWPPFYPFVLAGFLLANMDFGTSTMLLNLALFAANVFLSGFLVYRFSKSAGLGLAATVVFALEPRGLSYHSWVLSEPLFLCLLSGALIFLWNYFENQKAKSLLGAALLMSIVPVTRYVGAAYSLGFLLCVFLFTEGKTAEKFKKSFLFSVIAFLPIAAWSARNYLLTHRQFSSVSKSAFGSLIHDGDVPLPLAKDFETAYANIALWLKDILALPKANEWLPAVVLAIFFAVVFFMLGSEKKQSGSKSADFKIPASLLILIGTYFAGLVVILRISRYGVAIPDRYVYPVYGQLILLLFTVVYFLNRTVFKNKMKLMGVFLGILILGAWINYEWRQDGLWADNVRLKGADESRGMRWRFVNAIPWFPKNG